MKHTNLYAIIMMWALSAQMIAFGASEFELPQQENYARYQKTVIKLHDQQISLIRKLNVDYRISSAERAELVQRLKEDEKILVGILNQRVISDADIEQANNIVQRTRIAVSEFYTDKGLRTAIAHNLKQRAEQQARDAERKWAEEQRQERLRRERYEQAEQEERRIAKTRISEDLEREYLARIEAQERQAAAQRRANQQEYASEDFEAIAQSVRDKGQILQEETKAAMGHGSVKEITEQQLTALRAGLPEGIDALVGEYEYKPLPQSNLPAYEFNYRPGRGQRRFINEWCPPIGMEHIEIPPYFPHHYRRPHMIQEDPPARLVQPGSANAISENDPEDYSILTSLLAEWEL